RMDSDGALHRVVSVDGIPSGLGWLPDGALLVVSMSDQKLLRFEIAWVSAAIISSTLPEEIST
ncbi:MAG: hypothetical protein JSU83_04480, partial [Deltaproteobacteria bacterium]